MNVNCEHCGAGYEVDDDRIPPEGVQAACLSCGSNFWVRRAFATAPTEFLQSGGGSPSLQAYEVGPLLGKGGMATVYLATERATGRRVALKVMHAHLSVDSDFQERFQREVRAVSGLEHPNILSLDGYGEEDGRWFMISEYAEGGTVEQLLRRLGKLPPPVAVTLAADMLAGLSYAHSQGVIHRDIKPPNLLLTAQGLLRVGDFGIAKTVDGGETLTQTGVLVGTPAYMSPEQAAGKPIDGRSDLFSAGTVFYEMLTGVNPFHADQPHTALLNVLKGGVKTLFESDPTIPPALELVVERLLEKEPERRFQSASEALAGLQLYLESCRRRYGTLRAEIVSDPAGLKKRLDEEQAEIYLAEGRNALQAGPAKHHQAALLLYRAVLLDPDHDEANDLLEQVCANNRLDFTATPDPRILDLERGLEVEPESPAVLQRLAQLYRAQGNLFKAAAYYKRYLRLRPTDSYAASQLSLLTGESPDSLQISPVGTSMYARQPSAGGVQAGGSRELAGGASAGTARAQVPRISPRTPPPKVSAAALFWEAWGKKLLAIGLVAGLIATAVILLGRTIDTTSNGVQQGMGKLAAVVEKRRRAMRAEREALSRTLNLPVREARKARLAAMTLDSAVRRFRNGKLEESLIGFGIVLRRYPKSKEAAKARLYKGKALMALGRHKQAVAAFGEFVTRNPGHEALPECLLRRAQANYRLRNLDASHGDLSELLREYATSSLATEALLARARVSMARKDRASAKADYDRVIRRTGASDPLHVAAREGLRVLEGKLVGSPTPR